MLRHVHVSFHSFLPDIYLLNNETLSGKKIENCLTIAQDKDNLLLYLDNCASYIASRISEDDPEKLHTAEYDGSPLVGNMLERLNRRLGLEPGAITFSMFKRIICYYYKILYFNGANLASTL